MNNTALERMLMGSIFGAIVAVVFAIGWGIYWQSFMDATASLIGAGMLCSTLGVLAGAIYHWRASR